MRMRRARLSWSLILIMFWTNHWGDEAIKHIFKREWPDLENMLAMIPATQTGEIRSERDLSEEILETVRQSGL